MQLHLNLSKMPRKEKRGEVKNKWTDVQLQMALAAVRKEEMKAHAAALKYGIPSSTFYDHLQGRSKKRYGGPPTVLSHEEEGEIVAACQILQEFGFPLTRGIVGTIVADYLRECKRSNPFKNSTPQEDWWHGFLRRWPTLSEGKPQHLQKCRAEGASFKVNLYADTKS